MALTLHQSGHGHSHGGLSSHGHSHEKGKERNQISNHAHSNGDHADLENNKNHGILPAYKSFCHFPLKHD